MKNPILLRRIAQSRSAPEGSRLATVGEAIRAAVAAEREACARMADERRARYGEPDGEWSRGVADAFAQIAAVIRARGTA